MTAKEAGLTTEDIMVDLETLGRRPGCAILSIGAVFFNPIRPSLLPTQVFYCVVRNDGHQEVLGLHQDPETVDWWEKQSPEARKVLAAAGRKSGNKQLPGALRDFNKFVASGGPRVRVWGNGADFDNAILSVAMACAGMKPSWEFWNNRCYSTLKSMAARGVNLPARQGVHHNALDDALHQARCAEVIMDQLLARGART